MCYISIDILLNTEEYLSKVKLSSYVKFPKYITIVFLALSIMMILEFIMDQLSIKKEKGRINRLENEILELKAKLYDQSQIKLLEKSESKINDSVNGDNEEKEN